MSEDTPSGILVPNARMVSPMIESGTPILWPTMVRDQVTRYDKTLIQTMAINKQRMYIDRALGVVTASNTTAGYLMKNQIL